MWIERLFMSTTVQVPPKSNPKLAREERKSRLQRIIRKGLPPFPQTALELTKILGGNSPDVQKAGRLISADPSLSAQVLRMCNSPMIALRSRVVSIEQATLLLGADRLRNLALNSSVLEFAKKALPEQEMSAFWRHSFMAAMLTQYLAQRRRNYEKSQAYIAGLLHDIGQVPQWMLVIEDKGKADNSLSDGWADNPSVETEYFGINHCELGGTMAGFWELMPSFVDVLNNHHSPNLAKHDSFLVRLVATIEFFLMAQEAIQRSSSNSEESSEPADDTVLLENIQKMKQLGEDLFGEDEWDNIEAGLEAEYLRLLPIVQTGLTGFLARSKD
jgi:HD-like signal output (HDOD) protein